MLRYAFSSNVFCYMFVVLMYLMFSTSVAKSYERNSQPTPSNDSVPHMHRRGSVLNIISPFFLQLSLHYFWVFQVVTHLVLCLQVYRWSINILAAFVVVEAYLFLRFQVLYSFDDEIHFHYEVFDVRKFHLLIVFIN